MTIQNTATIYNTPGIYNKETGLYNGAGVYNVGGGVSSDFIFYNDFSQIDFASIIGETTYFNPALGQVYESYFADRKSVRVFTNEAGYFRGTFSENPTDELTIEAILKITGTGSNNYCTEMGNWNYLMLESFNSYGPFLRLQIRADNIISYDTSKLSFVAQAGIHYYYKVYNSRNKYLHIAEEFKTINNVTTFNIFLNGDKIVNGSFNNAINTFSSMVIGRETNFIETLYSMFAARNKIVSDGNTFPVPTEPYF